MKAGLVLQGGRLIDTKQGNERERQGETQPGRDTQTEKDGRKR